MYQLYRHVKTREGVSDLDSFISESNTVQASKFRPMHVFEPTPWVGHIPFSNWLIRALSPSVFVELGTHTGNSYFSFCQSIRETNISCKAYAIDHWLGDEHAGIYGDEVYQKVSETNEHWFSDFSTLIKSSFSEAVSRFPNASIDLLHIDGAHSFENVREDFETWLPKLSPGAVVLFHDTVVKRDNFGVYLYWDSMRKNYEHLNFTHSNGLGVVQLPGGKLPRVVPKSPVQIDEMKNFFEALGDQLSHMSSRILRYERKLGILISQKNDLLNSGSWAITRPLRKALEAIWWLVRAYNFRKSPRKVLGGQNEKA
jgi:hypothetical protein